MNSVMRNGVNFSPSGPDRLQDDPLLDEVDGRLGDVLDAGGHERLLAAAEPHHADGDQRREPHQDDDLVDAEGPDGPLHDVGDGRELQPEDHQATASLSVVGLRPGKASEADT